MPIAAERFGLIAALSIGLGFTALLTSYAALWEREGLRAGVRDLATERLDILDASLLGSTEVLYTLRDLHAALGGMTESRFHAFAEDAIRRHPTLQAIEWIPRVPDRRRAELEAQRRAAGNADFAFTEIGERGELRVARQRAEYYPVYFMAPLHGNAAALGMDLASQPNRREALLRARDSGKPSATSPVRLAQESERQNGFLLFLPIYQGAPADLTARREQIEGYALAVFRAGNLMQHAFKDMLQRGISLRVMDRDAAETPLFVQGDSTAATGLVPSWLLSQLKWQSSRQFGGRDWVFEFAPGADFLAQAYPWKTLAAFVAGLLLTVLFGAHVHQNSRRLREIRLANQALREEVRERQRAEREAHAANRVKSEFLASMSHEIRTPLNAVLGYAQWLRADPGLKRDQVESVNAIILGGNHLLSHINDVLDLSRIEAGRVELRRDTLDVGILLRELESMFRSRAEEKRLVLRIGECPAPCRVEADACKLRQILINLVGNAIRFTQVGEVFLGCKFDPDMPVKGDQVGLRFDVIDTGPGIAGDDLSHIFEPFYQAGQRGQPGGSGLGLTIAVRLAGLMRGEISAVSELGEGSRFSLRLALRRLDAGLADTVADVLLGWRLQHPVAARVVIVDADPSGCDVLRRLLDSLGVTAQAFNDFAAAAPMLQQPDMAAMFIDPRGMDAEAEAWAFALPQNAPPVIAYTTLAFEQDRDRLLTRGYRAHLAKPLAMESLVECLRQTLDWRFTRLSRDFGEDSPPRAPDVARLHLPRELLMRLLTAAELHSTTMLKTCIESLSQLGEEEALLAAHLRQLMRAYDMSAIARLLTGLPHDPD